MAHPDAFQMARALESFAKRRGFVAPQAFYIVGSFNLKDPDGISVYSDEAHLWCEQCADELLAKAKAILPADKHEDHFVCATAADNEDTCPHCMKCGETLDGGVSSYAVAEEVQHYAEHRISEDDEINPRQAVEIAMILSAAPGDAEVIAIGQAALAAIAKAEGK